VNGNAPPVPAAGSVPPGAPPSPPGPPVEVEFPEVWVSDDLPGLPWCIAKGVAKAILLLFFTVLVPLELFYSAFAGSGLPISHPWSAALLIYGGGALALTSAACTAAQTTRLLGLFRFLNRATALVYLYVLASLATIFFGPFSFGGGNNGGFGAQVGLTFGFADLIYLFMIGTGLATLAALVVLYEDYKHPGERLPWDFPLSRRVRRRRERELAESVGVSPPA
jgi:hypothetical protein